MNFQAQTNERIKKNQGEPKGLSKGIKSENEGAKGSWKLDGLMMMTRRGFTRSGVLTKGTMAGVLTSGMTGIVLDGVKIVNKHTSHL